jgi:hypothetical protein
MTAADSGSIGQAFCFEIEAILTFEGFDQFCPLLRQRALKYFHIPAALFLALNKIASNLEGNIYKFMT